MRELDVRGVIHGELVSVGELRQSEERERGHLVVDAEGKAP